MAWKSGRRQSSLHSTSGANQGVPPLDRQSRAVWLGDAREEERLIPELAEVFAWVEANYRGGERIGEWVVYRPRER